MTGPQSNDPSLARFRRGEGTRVGPPGPPPPVAAYAGPVGIPVGPPPGAVDSGTAAPTAPRSWAPEGQPISVRELPSQVTAQDPGDPSFAPPPPTFGELVDPAEAQWAPAQPGDEQSWLPVDGDPGRTTGIVSIVVGFFVGIVGVFIGIASLRQSRRVGLAGALGTAGIVVSMLNIVIGGAVGISWVRYEVSLSQQCALVGPGQYLTQSGDQVGCP